MTSCEMPICENPFGRDHFEREAHEALGDWSLTDDHIVPKADGGSNARENLRPAHRLCNRIAYSRQIGRSHRCDLARIEEARQRFIAETC